MHNPPRQDLPSPVGYQMQLISPFLLVFFYEIVTKVSCLDQLLPVDGDSLYRPHSALLARHSQRFLAGFLTLNITDIPSTKTPPPSPPSQSFKSMLEKLQKCFTFTVKLNISLTLIRMGGAGNKFETPKVPTNPLNPHRGFMCKFVVNFFCGSQYHDH